MNPSPDAYNAKILSTLEEMRRDIAEIKNRMGSAPVSGGGGRSGDTASDSDLDGQHGDPLIKYDPKPKYWTGGSYAGSQYSETSPEYLDAMARYLDACAYMAKRDADTGKDVEKNEKSAKFKGLDAARARGWAARLRAGWQSPGGAASSQSNGGGAADYDQTTGEVYGGGAESDIPFLTRAAGIWRA